MKIKNLFEEEKNINEGDNFPNVIEFKEEANMKGDNESQNKKIKIK